MLMSQGGRQIVGALPPQPDDHPAEIAETAGPGGPLLPLLPEAIGASLIGRGVLSAAPRTLPVGHNFHPLLYKSFNVYTIISQIVE